MKTTLTLDMAVADVKGWASCSAEMHICREKNDCLNSSTGWERRCNSVLLVAVASVADFAREGAVPAASFGSDSRTVDG